MNVKKSTEDSLDSVRVLFVFGVVFVLICFAFVGGDFCFYFFSVGKHYKGSLEPQKLSLQAQETIFWESKVRCVSWFDTYVPLPWNIPKNIKQITFDQHRSAYNRVLTQSYHVLCEKLSTWFYAELLVILFAMVISYEGIHHFEHKSNEAFLAALMGWHT